MKEPKLSKYLGFSLGVSLGLTLLIVGMMLILGIENKSSQTILVFFLSSTLSLGVPLGLIATLQWMSSRDEYKRYMWEQNNRFTLWYREEGKSTPTQAEVFPLNMWVCERRDGKPECRLSFEHFDRGIKVAEFSVASDWIVSLERNKI